MGCIVITLRDHCSGDLLLKVCVSDSVTGTSQFIRKNRIYGPSTDLQSQICFQRDPKVLCVHIKV